jgi:phage-related protein
MAKQGTWTVDFYFDARDRNPVLDFIDALPKREQAKLLRALGLLQEFGPLLSMPHARPIEGKLWELRGGARRIFYFAHTGRRFVLLHAYQKRTQAAPSQEIETAVRRMKEYVEREGTI